jgi:8-oxo-dGTP pyrophosphatase MutT (NUDIX family)
LSSKIAHQNPWFKISEHKVKRPDGTPGTYFVLRNTPAVFMVAVTPKFETFLVGLWRYPTSQFSWEIPGGGSEGQKPLLAAKRELLEEAGILAKKWKLVGKFQSFNGMSDEISYTYVATELTFSKEHSQKEEGIAAIKKSKPKKSFAND